MIDIYGTPRSSAALKGTATKALYFPQVSAARELTPAHFQPMLR
jgi:hypothetical protein